MADAVDVVSPDVVDVGGEVVSQETTDWFARLIPRPEIVFIAQMLAIYVVLGVSLYNLTRGSGEEGKFWIALLSSCLGYMLPNPKLETRQ